MLVKVLACQKPKHFRDFLDIPFLLHQKDPDWVPPLRHTVQQILDKKNPFFKNATIKLWVAYSKNKPIGRIVGIRNETHNKFYNEKIAFWGFFEANNCNETAGALFKELEHWAAEQALTELRGPYNPSVNYECGIQISAFDTRPFVMMPQNPEYYPVLIENQGYEKIKDLEAWKINAQDAELPARTVTLLESLKKKYDISIRKVNIKEFTSELNLISSIYNDAWNKNWGYLPWDFDEFNYLAADLKAILDPNLIYIAEIGGEPCGFSIGIPDLNQVLLRNRNGKLFPFNFLKLIWQLKVKKLINQLRIPLLGVLKKYQHIPIGGMLYYEYIRNNERYLSAECSWILEDNQGMRKGLKLINASHYKTYRIYEKKLM